VSDLGATLRRAREDEGLSLAGMAKRTGYARSYLGNAETGVKPVTAGLIRAYERVLGDNVKRRALLIGTVSTLVVHRIPDEATAIAADLSRESSRLLAGTQTSHEVDKTIAALVSRDTPSIASLAKWSRRGSPVLRVNATGILAKVGSPVLDGNVARQLRADAESRELYLTAVLSRVLAMPWADAGNVARTGQALHEEAQLAAFASEVCNPGDAGARWCAVVMLARTRASARREVDAALTTALKTEPSGEHLRAIGYVLAGLDPIAD
jgi:transcriptional regulator with XRE-family HTH domain